MFARTCMIDLVCLPLPIATLHLAQLMATNIEANIVPTNMQIDTFCFDLAATGWLIWCDPALVGAVAKADQLANQSY